MHKVAVTQAERSAHAVFDIHNVRQVTEDRPARTDPACITGDQTL